MVDLKNVPLVNIVYQKKHYKISLHDKKLDFSKKSKTGQHLILSYLPPLIVQVNIFRILELAVKANFYTPKITKLCSNFEQRK